MYDKMRLPRTPLIELKEKKLESLVSKYFSIPSNKLWYFPDPPSLTTSTVHDKNRNYRGLDNSTDKRWYQRKKSPEKEKITGKVAGNKISWKEQRMSECSQSLLARKACYRFLNFNTV